MLANLSHLFHIVFLIPTIMIHDICNHYNLYLMTGNYYDCYVRVIDLRLSTLSVWPVALKLIEDGGGIEW